MCVEKPVGNTRKLGEYLRVVMRICCRRHRHLTALAQMHVRVREGRLADCQAGRIEQDQVGW